MTLADDVSLKYGSLLSQMEAEAARESLLDWLTNHEQVEKAMTKAEGIPL